MSNIITLRPRRSTGNERLVYGGISSTITFFNNLPNDSVRLYSIDLEAKRTLVSNIAPGSSHRIRTNVGNPWEIVVSYQEVTLTLIYVHEQEHPLVEARAIIDTNLFPVKYLAAVKASAIDDFRSAPNTQNTSINFVNHLQVRVKICWFDYNGRTVYYGTIAPQGSSLQKTYVGHCWAAIAENEKHPFAVFYGARYDGTALITSSLLSGQRSE